MTTVNTMYANPAGQSSLPGEQVELVRRIAYRLRGRLPECVQLEDLVQAGMVGLLEARERFRDDEGASFKTFAGIRIHGAMLDEIRRGDWTPRSVHRAGRSVAKARHSVESRKGSAASRAEVASEAGLSMHDYHKTVNDVTGAYLHSLDEHDPDLPPHEVPAADGCSPAVVVEHLDLCDAVARASKQLPGRDRLLLSLYYEQHQTLRKIAERLGVSESRACQLHRRAITRVREHLVDCVA